ncbi:MAG: hypothetical protein AAGD06_29600 [Acidobacteriota bacterium]
MPRDLAELFEKKRHDYADLRPARYVRPEGAGLHRVALVPSGREVLVGTLVGNATFKPGAFVVVGTYAGRRQRMVVGLAPPGYRGASAFPDLTDERRIGLDVPASLGNYLAIWHDGAFLHVGTYGADGVFGGDLGQQPASGFRVERALPIVGDQEERVGDGGVLWIDDAGALHVTDVRAATTHTYTPNGREVGLAARVGGWVYWFEHERVTRPVCPVTLRCARTDLDPSTVETIGTTTVPHSEGGGATVEWGGALRGGFSSSHGAIVLGYTFFGQTGESPLARLALGSGSADFGLADGFGGSTAMPDAFGGAVTGHIRWTGEVGDDDGGPQGDQPGREGGEGPAPQWDPWLPPSWGVVGGSGGVDSSGEVTVLYTVDDEAGTVRYGSPIAPGPAPDLIVDITPHPERGLPLRIWAEF